MDESSLNGLLLALNSDLDQAAAMYENIRKKLITFFRVHSCSSPEDYADVTLDRVARKISQGVKLDENSPYSFFIGVARNILHEYKRWETNQAKTFDDALQLEHPFRDARQAGSLEDYEFIDRQFLCLERCMKLLTEQNRILILEYYQGEASARIKNRTELAYRLNIPMNSLRIRALRLRGKLRLCVESCIEKMGMA